MQTLDAPVFEVNQDSEWYKSQARRRSDIKDFFAKFKDIYGVSEGFLFYHSEYFGVREGSKAYEIFKEELVKNPTEKGFYPFKKRSNSYKEIHLLLEQIEDNNPFKSHDVLGINNITGSHWVLDRWFYGVRDIELIAGKEVAAVDYQEYLNVVIDSLSSDLVSNQ